MRHRDLVVIPRQHRRNREIGKRTRRRSFSLTVRRAPVAHDSNAGARLVAKRGIPQPCVVQRRRQRRKVRRQRLGDAFRHNAATGTITDLFVGVAIVAAVAAVAVAAAAAGRRRRRLYGGGSRLELRRDALQARNQTSQAQLFGGVHGFHATGVSCLVRIIW